jgi:hypothetical protein
MLLFHDSIIWAKFDGDSGWGTGRLNATKVDFPLP